jgi:hypothetical protein
VWICGLGSTWLPPWRSKCLQESLARNATKMDEICEKYCLLGCDAVNYNTSPAFISTFYLHIQGWWVSHAANKPCLLSNTKDGGSTFLQSTGDFLMDCTAPLPRRKYFHGHCCEIQQVRLCL